MQFSTVVALAALAQAASAANAISQITDGQIQATTATAKVTVQKSASVTKEETTIKTATNTIVNTVKTNQTATVHQQASNAAGHNVVGFGAVAVAAALLL